MKERLLHPKAWVALTLQGLYSCADALCFLFVSVYFWRNSHDFGLICRHYLVLYTVTPIVFLLAGWYAQARDRLHCFRAGLVLHACYYGILLLLRESAPAYASHLGFLLGVTWGVYWAGANTFAFDVSLQGRREFYFGVNQGITGMVRFISPLVGTAVISLSGSELVGYHYVFAMALVIYLCAFALSFLMPSDSQPRPFRIRRALFPGKDQRDWRLIMLAAMSLAGTYNILGFLLALLVYMKTESEVSVGGLASLQAAAAVIMAFFLARAVVPANRKKFMFWGVVVLVTAGAILSFNTTVATIFLFGLFRSVAAPMFGVAHFSLRLDTITHCAEDPAQRIEYMSAWEVPLAMGRVVMMLTIMGLYNWLSESDLGLRIAILIMCSIRIITYLILTRTSAIRNAGACPVALQGELEG